MANNKVNKKNSDAWKAWAKKNWQMTADWKLIIWPKAPWYETPPKPLTSQPWEWVWSSVTKNNKTNWNWYFQQKSRQWDEKASAYKQNFEKWLQWYIRANKEAWDLNTNRTQADLDTKLTKDLSQFAWQKQDLAVKKNRNIADYQKFTSNEQQDFNRQISVRSTAMATAMNNSSNAFGKRWLLNSWFMHQASSDLAYVAQWDMDYMKLQSQRRLDAEKLNLDRNNYDIDTSTQRLNTQQNWTNQQHLTTEWRNKSDSVAWWGIELADIQAQWDQAFNTWMWNNYMQTQDQNDYDVIQRRYGLQLKPPSNPTYRQWWQYYS